MRRAREPGPACENCGLETEYLFDGVIYPTAARDKFILDEPVKLSRKGTDAGLCRDSRKTGRIVGFARDGVCIRVVKDGTEQPQYWHMDYWTPRNRTVRVNKHGTYGQPQPAKVCQRCRPPSNLEIQEMLADAKTR